MRGAEGVRDGGPRACLLGGKTRPGSARVRSGESRAGEKLRLFPAGSGDESLDAPRPQRFGYLRPRFGYRRLSSLSSAATSATSAGSVGNGRRRARPSGLRGEDRPASRNKPTVSGPWGGEQGRADGAGRRGSGYGSPPSRSRLRREGEVRAPRGRSGSYHARGKGEEGGRAVTPPRNPPAAARGAG